MKEAAEAGRGGASPGAGDVGRECTGVRGVNNSGKLVVRLGPRKDEGGRPVGANMEGEGHLLISGEICNIIKYIKPKFMKLQIKW
jgi:hypothetical protein